jgi:hypothetical protein
VLVNGHPLALLRGKANQAKPCSPSPAYRDGRNQLYEAIVGSKPEAVVAFCEQAREALRLWSPPGGGESFEVPHSTSNDETVLRKEWRDAIVALNA